MNRIADPLQRIERLAPLSRALEWIDHAVTPVAERPMALGSAAGAILAHDVVLAAPRPPHDLSWRDGWALASEDTVDAGGYAPAVLSRRPVRLDVGEALPADVDAVAPIDAVDATMGSGEALATVAPGDGVLARGCDGRAGEVPKAAGAPLRAIDIAALAALGIAEVSVRRPRLAIVARRGDPVIDAICSFLAAAVAGAGGDTQGVQTIETVQDTAADALILVGGTGAGRADDSVRRLAADGRVDLHGIALTPGETTALGVLAGRPVLLVPGRLDAALAVWLVLGRRMMARLVGGSAEAPAAIATLTAKIVSGLGLAELVLLRRDRDGMAPLAAGHLPLSSMTLADAWTLVPPDSEGFPAGARITVEAMP